MIEETGVGIKNPLWFVGVVENRNDPRKEGRVQVRAFSIHGTNAQIPTDNLPWAICISGNYDPNYPIPPLNAWVFGFFIDGRDAQQPMILGLIPTQMTGLIDPEVNGWGVIPTENVNLDSQGSRAIDYGQPSNSRKARGEDIQNTDILFQEVNRLSADFSSIEEGLKIDEPVPGYNAVYPYNRVIETAGGHSIELDDSPGGERIRIWHSKGSFVEMHQSGAMVIKAANDLWLGAEGNICIVSKTQQYIKVEGDAVMSVDGNMAFEVNGDMRHTVGGNYELSVGGQLNLNASEEIQARGAKLRLEANVEGVNIKAGKNISMQSGEAFNIKSGIGINQQAVGDINIKGDNLFVQGAGDTHIKSEQVFVEAAAALHIKGEDLFIQGTGDTNIKSAQVFLDASGNMNIKGAYTKIGNGQISLKGTSVAIDELIYLANGQSVTAPGGTAATAAEEASPTPPTEGTELPEPVAKSAGNGNGSGSYSAGYKGTSMGGTGGYMSNDDFIPEGSSGDGSGTITGSPVEALSASYTQNALTPLLDLIGQAEGAGYDTIFGGISKSDYPPKPLTALTVNEVLAWQDSIDSKYNSEASGRYQIIEDTLRGLKNNGIVSGGALYNSATQDVLAIALLKSSGLNSFLNGTSTAEQFGNSIAEIWASFPIIDGSRKGQGNYPNQSARTTPEAVLNVLKRVKDYSQSGPSASSTAQ